MPAFFAFIAGLLFGIGLIVAGMANPAKILGFLDITGKWDPSLAFVMAGAIAVGQVAFMLARRRTLSALGLPMQLPAAQAIDLPLVGVGTRYAGGCTSGHGVCGLSRLSPRSLVATLAFMGTGFATVFVVRHVIGA